MNPQKTILSRGPDRWYQRISDPMVLVFMILVIAWVVTFIIPAGEYERISVDGRTRVVADSFHYLNHVSALHFFDIFVALPQGFIFAAKILFIVLISSGLFHLLQQTGALENVIGVAVHKAGTGHRNLIITLTTFIYGFFGLAVGFENNIALVPLAVLISGAVGVSSLVGVVMAVGGIAVGFALSPINPYTLGVAQSIAELPMFSGALLRTLLVLSGLGLLSLYICKYVVPIDYSEPEGAMTLSKRLGEYSISSKDGLTLVIFSGGLVALLYGVFCNHWQINDISALFVLLAILIGLANGMGTSEIARKMVEGASGVIGSVLLIGLAAAIQVILRQAHIVDTVVHSLSALLEGLPVIIAAIAASVVQGVINLFVPSGSAQAMVTMPILIPLADLLGMSRQLMILAFQVGDGITNLVLPTSGGTLAMLALGRVSYEKWLKVMMPFLVMIFVMSWLFMVVGCFLGY